MDLNYPDFLGQPSKSRSHSVGGPTDPNSAAPGDPLARPSAMSPDTQPLSPNLPTSDFDLLLSSKLASLDAARTFHSPFSPSASNLGHFAPTTAGFGTTTFDPFNLPTELQGGVGNISSRRPSYAAESFTRSLSNFRSPFGAPTSKNSLASFAAANNYTLNSAQRNAFTQMTNSFENFSLNLNFSDFQARRPSQIAAPNTSYYPERHGQDMYAGHYTPGALHAPQVFPPVSQSHSQYNVNVPLNAPIPEQNFGVPGHNPGFQPSTKLDDGLMLRDQQLVALPELRSLYAAVHNYFISQPLCGAVLSQLSKLLTSPVVQRLVAFIKNLNNLSFNHKMLCLVANKNGKLDLLSYPANTNLCLQKDDLVIVDGDRGKDMVMILDPAVPLNTAILFNFLKKLEHLKSLTITDSAGGSTVKGLRRNSVGMDFDKNSSDDNEFVISLPTKQVLRFATPKEVYRLNSKFLEEKKAFYTCFSKIQDLGLSSDLELINVEYQSDFKKLIFYYYANFKRIDFRVLIKELFKVYKTRIWLCAVLPSNGRLLYAGDVVKSEQNWRPASQSDKTLAQSGSQNQKKYANGNIGTKDGVTLQDGIPPEYKISNDQLVNFNVQGFKALPEPTYFHLQNMLNLMANLGQDIEGNFYGFNPGSKPDRL
ncbi:hypothetical protein PUMCH_001470 [Australozyma saopauloensis]|uniref:PSP1 C-terminal domain-containing protein n=1 Tax=Australozyma saopauloensis TaxID=291208 RepID=A0AAX4H6K8_9ASCO|nr:hypothetical protein PUMCH_001470 [[Candida] saopauloensis]